MMTKLQILEKQNKDLRTRLDNRQVKAEIALISCREDIAALRTGAAALRSENSDLRTERDALLGENDALRQENAGLLVEVTILREKLGAMAAKEAKLEAMRKMDSSNSSKPPGSDGFKNFPNNREKSGKKQGGQKGHAGHSLKVPENATNSIVKPSKNMIESVLKEFAMSIDDDIKAIKSELLAGEMINVDETSMRCSQTLVFSEDGAVAIKTAASTTFGVCVRTYSNDYATFYTVNPQKDDQGAVRDGILPNYHTTARGYAAGVFWGKRVQENAQQAGTLQRFLLAFYARLQSSLHE